MRPWNMPGSLPEPGRTIAANLEHHPTHPSRDTAPAGFGLTGYLRREATIFRRKIGRVTP